MKTIKIFIFILWMGSTGFADVSVDPMAALETSDPVFVDINQSADCGPRAVQAPGTEAYTPIYEDEAAPVRDAAAEGLIESSRNRIQQRRDSPPTGTGQ